MACRKPGHLPADLDVVVRFARSELRQTGFVHYDCLRKIDLTLVGAS